MPFNSLKSRGCQTKYLLRPGSFLTIAFLSIMVPCSGQIADGSCKFLGNIISGYTPTNFTTYWNQVTPENAGKWGSVESTRDVMNWTALDNAYNTAKNNNLPFKQHTFVWGQQQPSWMSALSQQEQREEVEEWIRLFSERYPDADYIDVVNEPLHAVADYTAALGGSGTTGWDWVIWVFEKARQYCPNAKLILNDYNIINNNSATTSYLAIINILKARNLIDVIGEQGHFLETTDNSVILANLDRLAATGLPIQISEYDVNLTDAGSAQANKYMNQFPVLWTHPAIQGITLWGYKQGEIWRTDAYLVRQDGTERPALTWLKNYVAGIPAGTLCNVTGVEQNELLYSVYPNPSSDGRFIFQSKEIGSTIVIRDVVGRSVGSFLIDDQHEVQIQLDREIGMYFLEIRKGRNRVVEKLTVNP
jgi:endo-1,4-beta-xylanase